MQTMEEEDDTELFLLRPRKGRKTKRPAKPLTINISTTFAGEQVSTENKSTAVVSPSFQSAAVVEHELTNEMSAAYELIDEMDDWTDQQLADTLCFYEETHEDQDPAYVAFAQKLAEEERQAKLAALDAHDQQTRTEIEAIISDLCKEKQAATDRSLEKYKQRAAEEEKIRMQRYQELYRQKTESNLRKINEGIEILQQRHQKDLQTAMGQHQQQVRSRRLNEQMAAAEWNATSQNVTNRFNQQLTAFRNKGNELKKQTEADYQREKDKIHKQYLLRLQEVDISRQKLHARLYQQIQQLRQRYLKRHLQKLMKEKEELLSQGPSVSAAAVSSAGTTTTSTIENVDSYDGDLSSSLRSTQPQRGDAPKPTTDDQQQQRSELNPSSPIRSAEKWVDEMKHAVAGASARHKHRKGVMSQTTRQLNIEIHNEGLWLSACPPESAESNNEKKNESVPAAPSVEYQFVPWGPKAFQILETVVAGEIPPGICEAIIEKHANAAELMSVQSGQVRCIVSDMRTSEDTASSHRVLSLAEQEQGHLKELEQKVAEMQKGVADAESVCARAVQEEKDLSAAAADANEKMSKATRIQEEFKQKFKSFLGPGINDCLTAVAFIF
jgi:hypothetical protein